MMTNPKHPEITVKLIGKNGNAMVLVGEVCHALRQAGCSALEIDNFVEEATSGDYQTVLQTCMFWVNVT